jgi:CubicO group peptidase (beta-lactamase class C family)
MIRRNFLFVFTVLAFLSSATWAQVPDKEKVIAGADRAFEKFTRAYVGPAPGCAAAVSLNGELVFEKAFGLADLELMQPLYKDHFEVQGYVVWFTSDKDGKVNRLHVGASRMRDMLFVRVK